MADVLLESVQTFWNEWKGLIDDPLAVNVVGLVMLLNGVLSFVSLFFVVAPYGRYSASASKGWGPKISAKVAWMLMESPSAIVFVICWVRGSLEGQESTRQISSKVVAALFLLHYIHRSFIFPTRMIAGSPMPVSVMLMAWVFCVSNGFLQGQTVSRFLPAQEWETSITSFESIVSISTLSSLPTQTLFSLVRFVAGVLLFFVGFTINLHSDYTLIALRKAPGSRYKIPRGGMFEFVSSANYFGEMVEWTGWALACGPVGPRSTIEPFSTLFSFLWPSLIFAIFTFCNLAPRGKSNHQWLLTKFKEEYPSNRKSVIPFLW